MRDDYARLEGRLLYWGLDYLSICEKELLGKDNPGVILPSPLDSEGKKIVEIETILLALEDRGWIGVFSEEDFSIKKNRVKDELKALNDADTSNYKVKDFLFYDARKEAADALVKRLNSYFLVAEPELEKASGKYMTGFTEYGLMNKEYYSTNGYFSVPVISDEELSNILNNITKADIIPDPEIAKQLHCLGYLKPSATISLESKTERLEMLGNEQIALMGDFSEEEMEERRNHEIKRLHNLVRFGARYVFAFKLTNTGEAKRVELEEKLKQ